MAQIIQSLNLTSTTITSRPFGYVCCGSIIDKMGVYEEVEFEDMVYDATLEIYHYPCPCGDRFEISLADMRDGEEIARCPSCSLEILVIYDAVCCGMDDYAC